MIKASSNVLRLFYRLSYQNLTFIANISLVSTTNVVSESSRALTTDNKIEQITVKFFNFFGNRKPSNRKKFKTKSRKTWL